MTVHTLAELGAILTAAILFGAWFLTDRRAARNGNPSAPDGDQ